MIIITFVHYQRLCNIICLDTILAFDAETIKLYIYYLHLLQDWIIFATYYKYFGKFLIKLKKIKRSSSAPLHTEAYSCHVKENKIYRYSDIYVVITTYYIVKTTYDGCRYNDILSRYNNILSRFYNIRRMLL